MERICQFNVRGRCNRSNCEFKHTHPTNTSPSPSPIPALLNRPCQFYQKSGNCRIGENCRFFHDSSKVPDPSTAVTDSDEEILKLVESDDDTVISGFTERVAVLVREPFSESSDENEDESMNPLHQSTSDGVIKTNMEGSRETLTLNNQAGHQIQSEAQTTDRNNEKINHSIREKVNTSRKKSARTTFSKYRKTSNNNTLKDLKLPKFDPDKFKPGYTPQIVKKGDTEYAIVVTGIKDTGLCGTYWSSVNSFSTRQRKKKVYPGECDESAKTSAKNSKNKITKARPNKSEIKDKTVNKLTSKTEERSKVIMPNTMSAERNDSISTKCPENSSMPCHPAQLKPYESEDDGYSSKSSKSTKSVSHDGGGLKLRSKNSSCQKSLPVTNQVQKSIGSEKTMAPCDKRPYQSASGARLATPRKVRFIPYDDYKWVSVGKEDATTEAVQYSQALNIQNHLVSFLRIKGNSMKGVSNTNMNRVIFVIIEGEISVVLHTSNRQFYAKKGDSFHIPPNFLYNLINSKVREAEISLFQF